MHLRSGGGAAVVLRSIRTGDPTTGTSGTKMPNVTRLNHAVLYVSNLDRSVEFYKKAFGFLEIDRMGDQMAFLRARGTDNHHDLGLTAVGANAPHPPRGATGLYHLAWEVATIDEL